METEAKGKSSRLLSLDVLRGGTIAAMILVNNPGDWGHDLSPARPCRNGTAVHQPTLSSRRIFFLWLRVSIVFAMEKRLTRCKPPTTAS